MSLIDRALSMVGLHRKKRSGAYQGAQVSRLNMDWIMSPLSADRKIQGDLRRLRARGRDLDRNDPYVTQYTGLLDANIIGPKGIRLQAQVRNTKGNLDKAVNDAIEAAWLEYCRPENFCVDGALSGVDACQLATTTTAIDGECFVRIVSGFPDNKFRFALQFIDADMLDENFNRARGKGVNEIRMGIEINAWRKPVAYWIFSAHPSETGASSYERVRVPAEDIIHLKRPRRVNQTRGVTWLHSSMSDMQMLKGYVEAELVAARTGAAKMGFFTQDPATYVPAEDKPLSGTLDAAPGTMEFLAPGVDFKEWDPKHPTQAFPDFLKSAVRRIAAGVRVSYNALANDLEGVNYSSIRSGLLIERDQWQMLQQWFIDHFLRRVYERWLEAALLSGALRLPSRDASRYKAAKWLPRGWKWVDPLKDGQAAELALKNRFQSRTEIIAEQGGDFEEKLEEISQEDELASGYGISLAMDGQAAAPVVPEGDAMGKPGDGVEAAVANGAGAVQDTALNGAQVDAMLKIIESVANGTVPKASAKGTLKAAFPFISPAAIAEIIDTIEIKEPKQVEAAPAGQPAFGDEGRHVLAVNGSHHG